LDPAYARAELDTARWVISSDAARALVAEGAVVLDARAAPLKKEAPLPGAQEVVWQDFSKPTLPNRGQLLDDDTALSEKIRALGISADTPVIAIADRVKGWGEDGRIVWTLRTLGHTKAFLVEGGLQGLVAKGPLAIAPIKPGSFVVARTDRFEIKKEQLVTRIGQPNVVILDTREPREYAGETPYGETRGGHVPGARHIFYRDVLAADGSVLPKDELSKRLAALGINEGTEIVSYCTGGIRSGFVTAVLNDAGYRARNFAGSMWDWSAAPAESYPLVKN
jgi:thiosulfate/3-mercaptopyruvate sulfurtransferase